MNWKKSLYFLVAGTVMIGGLTTVIAFSLRSKSVPKINFTQFDRPEKAGEAVGQRLWLELKTTPVLMFGAWPTRRDHVEAMAGFFAGLPAENKYDVFIVEPGFPNRDLLPAEAIEISARDETAKLKQVVQELVAQGKRVAIAGPSMFTSKLITDGPADRMEKEFGMDFISISAAPFPDKRDDEQGFEVECNAGNDRSGIGQLGCAVLMKARTTYRKKRDPSKFSATLDLSGEKDYMFLLTAPKPAPAVN